jgi:membrane protease YdiL (CAAX protease family)
MLKKLQQRPLLSAILIVSLYALWFIIPMLFKEAVPHKDMGVGISGALKEWSAELITASVLALIISLLGWWKNIGFQKIAKGGVKFLLPIFILIGLMLTLAASSDTSHTWFLGFDTPTQLLELLAIVLLLGFVEEGIFRGVLFYGLSTKLTPFYTVIISAITFGLFHFVNIAAGAALGDTISQVMHAMSMGFLYAVLRLRIHAIWPLMIMHGLWDFSLFVLQSTLQAETTSTGESSAIITGLAISVPSLMYGSYVYWRWSRKGIKGKK